MRVTAFFTSRVIALDFLRWAGAGLAAGIHLEGVALIVHAVAYNLFTVRIK